MSRDLLNKLASELEATGHAKGYRQAVRDIRRELNNILDNMLRDGPVPAEPHTKAVPTSQAAPLATQARNEIKAARTGHELVLDLIGKRPGLRGAEIVAELQKSSTPVHERTVRTAIFRLKKGGTIKSVEGRWYVSENYKLVFG